LIEKSDIQKPQQTKVAQEGISMGALAKKAIFPRGHNYLEMQAESE